ASEPTSAAPPATDGAEPDNLQLIDGVGPKLEQFLHREGIKTFAQLATLERRELDALQAKLTEFPGRIEREQWVPQARAIVSGTTKVRVVPRGERDDLKRIKGVGPVLERWLHGQGIYRFADLTALNAAAVAALSSKLEDFPGRVERGEWIRQSTELAGETSATT
ncbi:MAG: helix-hairpin-helix domain-containing protein, partial [Gaiellaceae bacterium]